jgi:DNA replicative helicase MCM subunit Mcm2 (Cdc46/Mcm family)
MIVPQEYYVAFTDVDAQLKVRDLTSDRIGMLVRITGQVPIS